jgi:hypothetical protein
MTTITPTHQEIMITYLSEILNGSITLSEVVKDKRKADKTAIEIAGGELFSIYQGAKTFYFLSSDIEDIDYLNFFTTFEDFNDELKHVYLYDLKSNNFVKVNARIKE